MLSKIIKELIHNPSILMKYTDGGTDQRNTLQSVKAASICLFNELDLDFMIAARNTQLGAAKRSNGTSLW